jgi:hypothetical protein
MQPDYSREQKRILSDDFRNKNKSGNLVKLAKLRK